MFCLLLFVFLIFCPHRLENILKILVYYLGITVKECPQGSQSLIQTIYFGLSAHSYASSCLFTASKELIQYVSPHKSVKYHARLVYKMDEFQYFIRADMLLQINPYADGYLLNTKTLHKLWRKGCDAS